MASREMSVNPDASQNDVGDQVMLRFRKEVFTKRDLKILEGEQNSLNDGTINFFLDLIEMKIFSEKDVVFLKSVDVLLIKIGRIDEEEDDKIAHKVLEEKKVTKHTAVIVFPLNSTAATDTDSGTHRSLVMFYSPNGKFFHFDSSKGQWNLDSGNKLIKRISPELEKIYRYSITRELYNVNVQAQDKAYDCGIHVLMNAKLGVQHLLDHGNDEKALKMEAKLWTSKVIRENLLNFVQKRTNQSEEIELTPTEVQAIFE